MQGVGVNVKLWFLVVYIRCEVPKGIYLDTCVYGRRHLFWDLRFPVCRRVDHLATGHPYMFYIVLCREDKYVAACARSVCDIANGCFPATSARFAYSDSPDCLSKAPWSVYPKNIREAANATKLNSNKRIRYRNSDSDISHTGVYIMLCPKTCIQVIVTTFFRIKMRVGRFAVLKFIV